MNEPQSMGSGSVSPGTKRVQEILASDVFRRGLDDLVSDNSCVGQTRVAFRVLDLEAAEFGYVIITCTPEEGQVRKVYRSVFREETDSFIRCSSTLALRCSARLQRLGWTECAGYSHESTGDLIGACQVLEVCVQEPDGPCRNLKLIGADLAPDRKVRRLGRGLARFILDLLLNTRRVVADDLKKHGQ